ncbi:MAG: hypothetical protein BAJATHORv1_20533 [Candidatus Thorarchaeota archaeon]|nr:MAG: hypothetical protein BAJATHORv1_20533 [Candidatus Thorarchaeota archaeon]
MACRDMGVVLDTCVFVNWVRLKPGYGTMGDLIRSEKMCIVVGSDLKVEYIRQLEKRIAGSGKRMAESMLRDLAEEGILKEIREDQQSMIIIHRKDQHVMNCALTNEHDVGFILTDNKPDFDSDKNYRLPIVLTCTEFINSRGISTHCSEAKRVFQEIRQIGDSARLQEE